MTVTAFPVPQSEGASAIVARNLRLLMAERKVTQGQLAKVLGISQPNVSKRLQGHVEFGLSDLDALAAAFELEVSDLCDRQFATTMSRGAVMKRYQRGFLRNHLGTRRERTIAADPSRLSLVRPYPVAG